jgi:hypothetical protein
MIFTHALVLVLGALLALAVLGSALKTVVLPRQGFPRLSQFVFALVHRLLVHPRRHDRLASSLRGLYAPVALVSLPLAWMILMMTAFTGIYWGSHDLSWSRAFEISVSSVTTMGFAEPKGAGRIWIAFVEAIIGLGLVALLISYLPTIYSAYNDREKGTNRLRPIAGLPPSATEFLQSLQRLGALESPDLWRNSADWMLDLEQTHTAFPILSYFPESDPEQSWVATVGSLLDASALVFAVSDRDAFDVFADSQKGPLTVLVYGLSLIVRIAQAVNIPLPPPTPLPDLMAQSGEPAPPIGVSRDEYEGALATLSGVLTIESGREETAWRRFAWIRSAYEPALRALAGVTLASPAPWTTDRPAVVGRPRFLGRRPLRVDWSQQPPLPVVSATPTGG